MDQAGAVSTVADGAVDLRIDVILFAMLFRECLLCIFRLEIPVELGHLIDRSEMFVRIAVALNAPRHRQFFVLVDDFHLVDASVASLTADA